MEQCLRENLPFPKAISEAPILTPGLELFDISFMDLSCCRQIGMSLGPIPWTAITDYCKFNKIREEQTCDMHYLIRKMDEAYLDHCGKKK